MRTVEFVSAGRGRRGDPTGDPSTVDVSGGWQPLARLGAPTSGGLALPSADPTAAWMYAPRGVFLAQDRLVVADTGNHRVLIWAGVPSEDETPCDVVLGQPDATTEGPAAGGRGPERGMNLPVGVLVHDGRLVVADAWHHRVLVWDSVPDRSDVAPDLVLGQDTAADVAPNRGGGCDAASFYWPFGVAVVGATFWVADTGNRRVLGWHGGVPRGDRPADIVLGQPDPRSRDENRGNAVAADSFRWPHALAGDGDQLLVADAGNHRVLGWNPLPAADRPADTVAGQPGFHTADEWPYAPQTPDALRFPYAVTVDSGRTAVADTANNRVLLWDGSPVGAATAVLGQPDFTTGGENRWLAVDRDTLCWPYGISLCGDTLAVADSGNNRVTLWRRS